MGLMQQAYDTVLCHGAAIRRHLRQGEGAAGSLFRTKS